jgi:hypothetical protein
LFEGDIISVGRMLYNQDADTEGTVSMNKARESDGGEWEADLGFIDKELAKVSPNITNAKEHFVSLPSEGFPPTIFWIKNSQLPGDHAAAGILSLTPCSWSLS